MSIVYLKRRGFDEICNRKFLKNMFSGIYSRILYKKKVLRTFAFFEYVFEVLPIYTRRLLKKGMYI